jgi:hypothetical protein
VLCTSGWERGGGLPSTLSLARQRSVQRGNWGGGVPPSVLTLTWQMSVQKGSQGGGYSNTVLRTSGSRITY